MSNLTLSNKKKILITGASGFIGSNLLRYFELNINQLEGYEIIAVTRTPLKLDYGSVNSVLIDSIDEHTNWLSLLSGVDYVIHMAARVHRFNRSPEGMENYLKENVGLTENLANQAKESGVKRFIFLSTIKVNGEKTSGKCKFDENSPINPSDSYAKSKFEAEVCIKRVFKNSKTDYVIIRTPLVYGPGVKANYLNLIKLVKIGMPLPFNALNNRRSMLYVENLTNFIFFILNHPLASNQIFVLADSSSISTKELIQKIAKSLNGSNAKLFSISEPLLRMVCSLVGRNEQLNRLIESLEVDCNKVNSLLGWTPTIDVETGIQRTVTDFLGN